ncbi:MAG: hypothetical protein IJO29_08980 [Oscillospiraceae bacterium]|nr:hypothetical protein [Oscillospiraceae bacterium]
MNFFKKYKEKIKKSCQASISILLCIIITPVISIAGMLVEFSRYQSTINLLNELMDASALSVLADYDTYLKDRFGLYAISQEADISDAYVSYFGDNTALLGGSVSITDTATASGDLALSDIDIIKQQIVDYAESTDLMAFAMDDLNLDYLLEFLDGIAAGSDTLNNITNAAGTVSDTATKIKELIEAAEALKTAIESLISATGALKTSAETFITSITDLLERIKNANIEINPDEGIAGYIEFVESYIDDITEIANGYDDFTGKINDISSAANSVVTEYGNFKTALDAAMALLDDDGGSDSSDSGDGPEDNVEESIEETGDALDQVLQAFDDALDDAFEGMIDGLKDSAEAATDAFTESLEGYVNDTLNFGPLVSSVTKDPVTGEYTITEEGMGYIDEILTLVSTIFTDGADPAAVAQGIIDTYLPDFSALSLDTLKNALSTAIDAAEDAFEESASDIAGNILTKLVNTIRGMFKLDVVYNADMNAYVSADRLDNGDNPYQDFLDAISAACDAAEGFVSSLGSLNFLEALKKIAELFKAIYDAVNALVGIVTGIVSKLMDTISMFRQGGAAMYEFLLIVAYMTHNLPDRTCGGDFNISVDFSEAEADGTLELNGEATTGFEFSQIPNAASADKSGFGGIAAIGAILDGAKDDDMFVGAELEYILGGTSSELVNQAIGFFDIYFLRLLINLPTVLLDGEVATMAASCTIASWVVYLLVIIAEPFLDTVLIVNTPRGEDCPVPAVKLEGAYCTPSGIVDYISALGELTLGGPLEDLLNEQLGDVSGGTNSSQASASDFGFDVSNLIQMDYQTYMFISILFTVERKDVVERFAKLAALEAMTYYERNGGTAFSMDNAYAAVNAECSVELESVLGFLNFDSSVLQTKFTRTRGY